MYDQERNGCPSTAVPRSIYVAHVAHVAHTSDRDIASSEKTMFQNNIHTALPESPTAILIFSKVGRKLVCWAAPRVRKAKSLIRTPHHRHRHGGTQVRVASCMSPRVQEFPCMQFEYVMEGKVFHKSLGAYMKWCVTDPGCSEYGTACRAGIPQARFAVPGIGPSVTVSPPRVAMIDPNREMLT